MGFGKFLKGLVGGSEAVQPPAPTLANDDSELLELWRDRSTLTPGSRDELRVEMGIRGLVIPFDRPDPRTWITHVLPPELLPAAKADDDDDDDDDDGGDISIGGDPVVQLLSTWLVALKPSPDVTLVVSLPVWTPEPAPTQIPKGLHAAALIALGSVPPGTARSVGTEEVIDGIPAESTSYGATTLEPLGGGVLIHGEDARVLVGAGISLAEIAKHGPTHIVGGIRWPTSEEEWAAIVAAWTPETSSRLRGIWVLSDVVGTASHTSLSLADRMGIPAFLSASQLPVSVAAEALVTAAHRGDTSTLADLAKDAGEDALIEALAHALFRGAHSEAEKVLAAADGVEIDPGALAFAKGELASLRDGDDDAARSFYRAAADAGHGLARCTLASLDSAELDEAALIAEVDAAAEALSTEISEGQEGQTRRIVSHPVAVEGQILARWAAADYDEARAIYQDGQLELTPWTRQHLEILLDEADPNETPVVLRRPRWFVRPAYLAAWWLLQRNGHPDAVALALRLLERALELDPLFAEASATMADSQAAAGDEEGALATLDAALDVQPFHLPLLLLRAELRQQFGDSAGASEDWSAAIEWSEDVKPWVDFNLGIALIDAGKSAEAKAHIVAMDLYEDDAVIDALRYRLQSRG